MRVFLGPCKWLRGKNISIYRRGLGYSLEIEYASLLSASGTLLGLLVDDDGAEAGEKGFLGENGEEKEEEEEEEDLVEEEERGVEGVEEGISSFEGMRRVFLEKSSLSSQILLSFLRSLTLTP